jgi:TPR repeat protein
MRGRVLLFIVQLVLLLPLCAPAFADLSSAERALRNKDFVTAIKELRAFAEQGDTTAQTHLADIYYFGHGAPQDYSEAAKWYG